MLLRQGIHIETFGDLITGEPPKPIFAYATFVLLTGAVRPKCACTAIYPRRSDSPRQEDKRSVYKQPD